MVAILDEIRAAGGGAERIACDIAAGLDPERFESTLCLTRGSKEMMRSPGVPETVAHLERNGVEIICLERDSRFDLKAFGPLRQRLRHQTDVVHGHMFGSNIWAAVHGSLADVPVVIAHEQTWEFEGKPVRKLLDRHLVAPRVDAYIAVSEDDARLIAETEGIDPGLLRVVPNGIPGGSGAASPASEPGQLRRELGLHPELPLIGAVGRLHHQKGFDVLLEAMPMLTGSMPGAHLVIVGDGDERQALERQIAELGIADSVTLTGARTDVAEILPELDLAVLPSRHEGSPLTVMEYMQAARPIVATRVRGITQLIEDGFCGRLVPQGNPLSLAMAMAELLSDRDTAHEMGIRAHRRQQAEFSIDAVVRRCESIYEELWAAKASSYAGSSRSIQAETVKRS